MVKIWSANGELLIEWPEAQPDEVAAVAISPDSKLAAIGSHDKLIRLYDLGQGERLREFEGHRGPIMDLRFSADGQTILSASTDYTAKLWDLEGNLLLDLDRHAGDVRSAVFAPDGQTILTASHDASAMIWDLQGKVANTLRGHEQYLRSAHFSPDGRWVITASGDGTARVWPLAEAIVAKMEATFGDIYHLTAADLQAHDLDVSVCSPFLED
jgi:WD40 repeat protein